MAAKEMRFEWFKGAKSNQFYWRLVGKNGKTVCQSEGYLRKSDCLKTIEAIQNGAHGALIVEKPF